jgi:hypothetical protein
MQYQIDIFLSSLTAYWEQIVMFFPRLLAAVFILIFGWVCAKLVCTGLKRLLGFTHFDKFADKSGLEHFLSHGGVDLSLSGVISKVVFWLVMLIFIITSANAIGLTEVASLLNQLVHFLPKIIVAILILIFGTLLARFVNRIVFAWLNGIKFKGALTISTSTEYATQIFAMFVALEQLDIGTQLLTSLFVIVFGAIFLALAIAFGLGGKDWAAKVIDELDKNTK